MKGRFGDDGTRPELREECMMDVIRGERDGRQPLTKTVGIGSSWQVDGLDFRMRSEISSAEGSVKLESRRERQGLRKWKNTECG